MFRSIYDWAWVLFAYLCGKVLRIKKYRPVCTRHGEKYYLVRFSFSTTASRLAKLSRLWGYRMMTFEETRAKF